MLTGRAMYIWDLQASLKGGTAADLMSKAQSAKLSSIWVKIGDGAVPYANTQGNNTQILLDVVARCQVANILVLGYHVPHCPTAAAVQTEVGVCSGAVDDFLGMPPEMRDAVEDGAKPGYIEALDAIKAEQLAGGQMDQYFSGFAYHGVERAQ